MMLKSIKAGRTYVTQNGLQRRLVQIVNKDRRNLAGYIPIDRKGNEGAMRWVKLESFASEVLGESIS